MFDIDPRALHARLLVLDTHLDTPVHLGRPGWSILDRHDAATDLSQIDLPRMVEGGLDGGFWVIYTPQGALTPAGYAGARDAALERLLQIREMVARHERHFALALTAADAARIAGEGRRVVYMSVENAYPLGEDPSLLTTFHALGVRMLGLVHFRNNQFADSSTDEARWNGLSPAGAALVEDANRLGLVLDASHASDAALDRMIELSRAPVLLSHSGSRHCFDHPRNVDDARLRRLAERGGVIQVAAVEMYLKQLPEGLRQARRELEDEAGPLEAMRGADAASLAAALRDLDRSYGLQPATIDDYVAHLLHLLDVVGVEHVGIGTDWDGGGGVQGYRDVASLPAVTAALFASGYGEDALRRILGGNVLRVLGDVETCAAR